MTLRTLVSTVSVIGISCIVANAFAGESDHFSSIDMNPKGGFYIGLGGGYNSGKLRNRAKASLSITHQNLSQELAAINTDWDSHQNSLAPSAQMGFLKLGGQWAWGVKATYAYLKQRSDSGVLNSIFRTEATHLFSMLFSVGRDLTESGHSFIFLGVGPSIAELKARINLSAVGEVIPELPIDNINSSTSKVAWGANGQIEFIHYFNPTLFLSTSYTYTWLCQGLLSNSKIVDEGPRKQGILRVDRNIHYSNQAISLSINKVFAL